MEPFIGNFDEAGNLMCLHLNPASNSCNSEAERMKDSQKLSWVDGFVAMIAEVVDEGTESVVVVCKKCIRDLLCKHCFPVSDAVD